MTDIVPVPAMPTVPLYPALGSANFNNEAYAYGSSMRGVSQWQNAVGLACYTNALVSHERAIVAADASSTAVTAKDITVAAKDVTVSAKDTAVASANTAANAAATATAGANTATAQANRAQALADSLAAGPVTSFNGRGGVVTLNSADISGAGGVTAALAGGFDNTALMSDAPLGKWCAYSSVNGAGSDWPTTEAIVWWNVFTFGVSDRATQIASQCYSASQQNTYIRVKHDTTWSKWVPLGRKPVRYITDNENHMHGGSGEKALNAVNVWVYNAYQPAKHMPANPEIGDECILVMANGRTDSLLHPAPSGEPIMGLNEIMTIDRTNITVTFVYVGGALGWRIM